MPVILVGVKAVGKGFMAWRAQILGRTHLIPIVVVVHGLLPLAPLATTCFRFALPSQMGIVWVGTVD
jgi:hypothetical protein